MPVGYARVSTLDQNPSLQFDALSRAGCGKIFVEKASGAQMDRPQLEAAFAHLRDGDTLVVWKLSRLARSLKQVIQTVQNMQARNIGLWVLTQNIDTSTPEERLFFHMTAAFDEFQRELIVENTKAGLAAANRQGEKLDELNGNLREVVSMLLDDGAPAAEGEFVGTQIVVVA
ncbi:MAG: recombinase family protein [Albidovulum sp.]|nr:recombinase family protein [Albidovulum sp.]